MASIESAKTEEKVEIKYKNMSYILDFENILLLISLVIIRKSFTSINPIKNKILEKSRLIRIQTF